MLSEIASTLGCQEKPAEHSAPVDVALTNHNDDDSLLPTDVLYEILLRLPAKELCRLRVVCWSWGSLTFEPGFARAHAFRHPPLIVGIWNSRENHILDMSSSKISIVRRLHLPQQVYDLSIAQPGLLCVTPIDGCLSYVLDPAVSGELVATLPDAAGDDVDLQQDGSFFPSVPRFVPNRKSWRGSSPTVLGHVPSTGEYKALKITRYCTGRDYCGLISQERIIQTCNVITVSGTATAGDGGGVLRWRARPGPPLGSSSCFGDRVVVDGVAYFLRRPSYQEKKYSEDLEPDAIFIFDLATETWRQNTLRGPLSSNSCDNRLKFSQKRESIQLFELDGCLVTEHHKNLDCLMDIWFLDDMDIDKGFWTKRYSISCVPQCKDHSYRPPSPLHVLEDGRIVMWGAERERVLGVYGPRTNMYEKLASMEDYYSVRMYLGSLLCASRLQS